MRETKALDVFTDGDEDKVVAAVVRYLPGLFQIRPRTGRNSRISGFILLSGPNGFARAVINIAQLCNPTTTSSYKLHIFLPPFRILFSLN
jgi:hypothetical protein